MQYLLLIYANEKDWDKQSPQEAAQVRKEYGTFTESIVKSGNFKGGDELQRTSAATTIRIRNGKTQITDGPFAETREQLGGYYAIDAKDLDEAIKIASRIPSAKNGSIEVRPVVPMAKG